MRHRIQRLVQRQILFVQALAEQKPVGTIGGGVPLSRVPHFRRENVRVKSFVECPEAKRVAGAHAPVDSAQNQLVRGVGRDGFLARHGRRRVEQKEIAVNWPWLGGVAGGGLGRRRIPGRQIQRQANAQCRQ